MSAPQQEEPEAPEIVSEFPAPPKFFALYADGVESGPAPPEPMEPTYHMFGSPYSTQDVVPDLLPQPGKKLYAPEGDEGDAAVVDYKAQMKKYSGRQCRGYSEVREIRLTSTVLLWN